MALGDPGATSAVVGGKGVSLARLARAGFRVPPGFDVTTGAYLDFVASGGLLEPVLAAISAVDVSDAATFDAAAARIVSCSLASPCRPRRWRRSPGPTRAWATTCRSRSGPRRPWRTGPACPRLGSMTRT